MEIKLIERYKTDEFTWAKFELSKYECEKHGIFFIFEFTDLKTGKIFADAYVDCTRQMASSYASEFFNMKTGRMLELDFKAEGEPTEAEKFNYRLLGRLRSDCEYFLGNGGRCEKHLWATDVISQIEKMKELYNWFPNDKKPEWLTYDEILKYEKLMTE